MNKEEIQKVSTKKSGLFGQLSKKAKIIWGIVIGVAVLVIGFKIYDDHQPIDPLSDVNNVQILTNNDGDHEYHIADDAQVATKMRVALIKTIGNNNQDAIKAVQDNPKWYYNSDDYAPVVKAIGQDKTDKLISELNDLKDSIRYHLDGNQLTIYLNISPAQAKKDGIKLANRTFTVGRSN